MGNRGGGGIGYLDEGDVINWLGRGVLEDRLRWYEFELFDDD